MPIKEFVFIHRVLVISTTWNG